MPVEFENGVKNTIWYPVYTMPPKFPNSAGRILFWLAKRQNLSFSNSTGIVASCKRGLKFNTTSLVNKDFEFARKTPLSGNKTLERNLLEDVSIGHKSRLMIRNSN